MSKGLKIVVADLLYGYSVVIVLNFAARHDERILKAVDFYNCVRHRQCIMAELQSCRVAESR